MIEGPELHSNMRCEQELNRDLWVCSPVIRSACMLPTYGFGTMKGMITNFVIMRLTCGFAL